MKTIKISLTPQEKSSLRNHKIKTQDLINYNLQDLTNLLNAATQRAKEIHALIQFQKAPSIGPKFAQDLLSLGYYSWTDLINKDGAQLLNDYELQSGFWTDPCVEDQFRLAVHYAQHPDSQLNWWDFTKERKEYRQQNGYPKNRPKKAWHELYL